MKRIAIAVGVLVALWLAAALWAGSPAAGEVVTLRTTDSAGAAHETPLWIVDRDGAAWLRAGSKAPEIDALMAAKYGFQTRGCTGSSRARGERLWPCGSTPTHPSRSPSHSSGGNASGPR